MEDRNGGAPRSIFYDQDEARRMCQDRPPDTFYTEDVCLLRSDPQQIGVIERTTNDIDTHEPHPEVDEPTLTRHNDISIEAFKKFKKDGIPTNGTVLVLWQTRSVVQLIPTKYLVLADRSLVVGDIVKRSPEDSMSGTVTQTKMICTIARSSFEKIQLEKGDPMAPLDGTQPFRVCAEDLTLPNKYQDGEIVILQDCVGRIDSLMNDVIVRFGNGSIVALEAESGRDARVFDFKNVMDPTTDALNVGDMIELKRADLRRGKWLKGRYDHRTTPIGDVVHLNTTHMNITWLWRWGPDGRHHDQTFPEERFTTKVFEDTGGLIYDSSRSPSIKDIMRSHTSFMSGDKVRFKDPLATAVKYPKFKRLCPVNTDGYDLNVFTILLTNTDVKVLWQDQSEDLVPSIAVVPDYNMENANEVWPGEIVITNEKVPQTEDWIFQPSGVGVVQSVSSADRIALVKWFPHANIRYHQVGLDEHLDEISLLDGSTLGLEKEDISKGVAEEVTLYDIRTIGAICRRRGDYVSISGGDSWSTSNGCEWFGEVIDLNLDGTLTVRLGAAEVVKDIRISPERTKLVFSSDMDGPEASDDEYDTEDEMDSDYDSDDSGSSDGGEWTVDGEPIEQDEEWDTTSSASDDDVEMHDASAEATDLVKQAPTAHVSALDTVTETTLSKSLESPVMVQDNASAPATFEVLETKPPSSNPFNIPALSPLTAARLKRILKEHTILSSSLPPGIFVRAYESRLDLLRVLIVGPLGTPYEYAPFVIDFRIPPDYPSVPPEAYFHSWTKGSGPINPNLYENGKICLSLLGTWHAGEKSEVWSPSKSTILQVLVSILGLVLVKEPYYNEAGYEARVGSEDAKVPSQLYSERTYFASRAFISHALRNGVEGFNDVLGWLYFAQAEDAPKLLAKSIEAAQELIQAGDVGRDIRAGLGKMSKGAIVMLQRELKDLEAVSAAGRVQTAAAAAP